VTATYEQVAGAYLVSTNQEVTKGAVVMIPVELRNCTTSIKSMGISITGVPSGLTIKKGTWYDEYEYELSNFNKTKLQGASTLVEQGLVDGDIFTFQFTATDAMEPGTYTVEIKMILKYFDENNDELELPCQSVKVQVTVK